MLIWVIGLVFAIVKYKMLVLTPAQAADQIIATMSDSFEALKSSIKHVHVHDALVGADGANTLDFCTIGGGYVDHKTAIEHLGSIGYEGYISGEWINWSDPYEEHLPRELKIMKGYEL